VITGSEAAKPAIPESGGQLNFKPNPGPESLSATGEAKATSKPAIAVITDFGVGLSGQGPENSRGTVPPGKESFHSPTPAVTP
jgi:hypothetical protein